MSDFIGIGTSPLILLRAVRLAELGHRVKLYDQASVLGGAWASHNLLGFQNVESAVHLLENRPALSRSLQKNFGIEMMPDRCVALVGKRCLPMAPTRVVFHMGIGIKAFLRSKRDKAARSFKSACRGAICLVVPYSYPKHGASGIINSLSGRLAAHGGTIHLNSRILKIDFNTFGVTCDSSEETISADKAIIASRAFAPMTLSGAPLSLNTERQTTYNAVLHVQTPYAAPYSYAEILGDTLIKRVRNLATIALPSPSRGRSLLCVQYRDRRGMDPGVLVDQLLERLTYLGIVGRPSRVIAIHQNEIEVSTIPDKTLTRLSRQTGGRMEPIYSTDFGEGFVSGMSAFQS